ncbi:MAG: prepilin peptidase [Desulfovibrionaceae bacterium]|nr:prepilin peptidase [Desulfovibrionaceae bacterium]
MSVFAWVALLDSGTAMGLAAVLGLVCGSFYNVCIYRYVTEQSIVFPPSHCPQCKARLRPWELVPVLSWLCLRGRCGHCGSRISWRYPLVELISAALAALLAWKFGLSPAFAVFFVAAGVCIVASGIDFAIFILPDVLTLGGALLALPTAIWVLDMPWQHVLAGGLGGAGVFGLVMVLFKKARGIEGLGMGDVKLMLPIGFLCGGLMLPLVVLSAGVAALCSIVPQALLGKNIRTLRIPFGPFLCFGFLLTIVAGQEISAWWFAFVTGR